MKNILISLLFVSTVCAQGPNPTPIAPDNTGKNAEEKITAENQGESAADRETTKKIRQMILKTDSLSSLGKNVKVITINGKVMLRGPVHSEQEKTAIGGIAEKAVGKDKVTNQLEVKK